MLGQFVDVVQKVGVPNFLVVALDDRTKQFLDGRGCPSYRRSLRARGGGTDNHATSSLKFQILAEMLSVRRGCPALPRGEMWGDMGRYVDETPPLAGLLGAAARGTGLTATATSLDQALVVSATQAPPDASSPWP